MTVLLAILFVFASLAGAIAALRLELKDAPAFAAFLVILCTAALAGAVTISSEAGSALARCLGLFALLLASMAVSSAFLAARRPDRHQRMNERP